MTFSAVRSIGEVDESQYPPRSFPLRYKLTRGYNMAVYRSLSKLRRAPGYKNPPPRSIPAPTNGSAEKRPEIRSETAAGSDL